MGRIIVLILTLAALIFFFRSETEGLPPAEKDLAGEVKLRSELVRKSALEVEEITHAVPVADSILHAALEEDARDFYYVLWEKSQELLAGKGSEEDIKLLVYYLDDSIGRTSAPGIIRNRTLILETLSKIRCDRFVPLLNELLFEVLNTEVPLLVNVLAHQKDASSAEVLKEYQTVLKRIAPDPDPMLASELIYIEKLVGDTIASLEHL